MKFINIFERVNPLWPNSIDISDGHIVDESSSFYSPNLSHVWDNIENSVVDEWDSLMIWVTYQYIHSKCRIAFINGITEVNIKEIDLNILEKSFYSALHENGYEEMLKQYSR